MEIRKIEREDFSWGIWSEKKKEFVEVFQTEEEAKKRLQEIKKTKVSSK